MKDRIVKQVLLGRGYWREGEGEWRKQGECGLMHFMYLYESRTNETC
jgi:hypothetical protein